jgi:hypothetical protein
MKESKSVEQPHNYGNHYYAVQNRLDGRLHGDEAIHQPQQDTDYHQNFYRLKQRHVVDLSSFADGCLGRFRMHRPKLNCRERQGRIVFAGGVRGNTARGTLINWMWSRFGCVHQ